MYISNNYKLLNLAQVNKVHEHLDSTYVNIPTLLMPHPNVICSDVIKENINIH
jgi:hypothetical protein